MSVTAVRTPAEYEARAPAATSSSAPRKAAPCASARRRSRSGPRSSRATRDLFTPRAARCAARRGGRRERRRARAPLPAAQDLRGRPRRRRAERARGRARERDPRRAGRRSRARSCRSARPRRSSPSCRATQDREELGELHGDASAEFNDERLRAAPGAARSSTRSSRASRIRWRATRRRRASRCASSRRSLDRRRARARTSVYRRLLGTLVRQAARRRAGPRCRPRTTSPTCAGSRRSRRRTRRSARPRSAWRRCRQLGFDLDRGAEHQARSRRPAAEVAARLRDRLRPAEGRPPDHAGAGRAPRLPGVPARGRPRAPLRGLRPEPAVHVPQPLARPRADRDLLVHLRGDLARAGLARASTSGSPTRRRSENAEATIFLEALLYRRYTAKLQFELEFWGGFDEDGGTPRRLLASG